MKFKNNTGLPAEIFDKLTDEDFNRIVDLIYEGEDSFKKILATFESFESVLGSIGKYIEMFSQDDRYSSPIIFLDLKVKIVEYVSRQDRFSDFKIISNNRQMLIENLKINNFRGLIPDEGLEDLAKQMNLVNYFIDYIKKNREMVLLPGAESIPKQLTNLMGGLYPIKRFVKEYCTRESKKMQEEKTQKLEQAMKVCKAEVKPVESAKPKTREERVRDIEVTFTLCDQFLNDCLLAQEKGADFNSSTKTLERVVDRLFNDKKFNPFDHFEKNKNICVKTEEGFYKLKPNTPEKVLKTFEDKFKDARHELDIVTEKFYELNVPKILAERE